MPAKSLTAGIYFLITIAVLLVCESVFAQYPPPFPPATNYYAPQTYYVPQTGFPIVQAQLNEFDAYATTGNPSYLPTVRVGSVRGGQFWFRTDLLVWGTDDYNIPPLVTSNAPGTPLSSTIGVLGQPGTLVAVGNSLDVGVSAGARLTAGFYLDACRDNGIQMSFFGLSDDDVITHTHPSILARPFNLVAPTPPTSGENAELISHPDAADGFIQVGTETDLYMFDLTHTRNMYEDCGEWLDMVIGYRYARLDESLQVCDSRVVTSDVFPGIPAGTIFGECDRFETQNRFHGVDLGFTWEACNGPVSLDFLFKMALGNMRSKVAINGVTASMEPGQAEVVTQGGLLALPTNIGSYASNDFAVIPEVGANLSYRVSNRFEVSTGYTFIYFSQVARPGDQIDRNLNLTQLGNQPLIGTALPEFRFVKTDFWAQGFNFGATMNF